VVLASFVELVLVLMYFLILALVVITMILTPAPLLLLLAMQDLSEVEASAHCVEPVLALKLFLILAPGLLIVIRTLALPTLSLATPDTILLAELASLLTAYSMGVEPIQVLRVPRILPLLSNAAVRVQVNQSP